MKGRCRVALASACLVGCGSTVATGPAQTAQELAAALRAHDDVALEHMVGGGPERIAAARADADAELVALARAIAEAPVEPRAHVVLADGARIDLVQEGQAWRIDRGTLGRPALARPVDAVVALHDALARSRAEALIALLARAERTELAAELERWIAATADPEALEIVIDGESALVRTPTGEEIDLVRESGEWRVLELR